MSKYTRDIKPIDYRGLPQVAQPSNSLGADLANAVNTGIQAYAFFGNKKREEETAKLVGTLSDYEVELYKNGLNKRQVLERLDAKTRELAPTTADQGYLRNVLAQRRGAFIQREIVQEYQNEEQQRVAEINSSFQNVISSYPDLAYGVKRNPDNTVDEAEQLKVIRAAEKRNNNIYQAQLAQEEAQALLAGDKSQAFQGVAQGSRAINALVSEVMNPLVSEYIATVNNMDIQSDQTVGFLEEQLGKFRNVMGTVRQNVQSRYSSLLSATTDDDAIKLLEKRRDADLATLDTMTENLASTDISVLKKNAEMAEIVQKNLKLNGLNNMKTISTIMQTFPNVGTLLLQTVIADRPDIQKSLVREASQSLQTTLDGDEGFMNSTQQILDYFNDPDSQKTDPNILMESYNITKRVLSSKDNIGMLSQGEKEKVGDGLIGILLEASATDDVNQISEATKLLNSNNFQIFFEQLSEDRQQSLGTFINGFNQDVLVDSTDGLFKKLASHSKTNVSVSYDATKGQFVAGDAVQERLPSAGLGFNITKKGIVQRDVDRANKALEMIRKNAKYDPSGQSDKVLIDTLIERYLPEDIKVQGELTPFVPEPQESTQVNQEVTLSNQDTLRLYEERIKELEKQLLSSNN